MIADEQALSSRGAQRPTIPDARRGGGLPHLESGPGRVTGDMAYRVTDQNSRPRPAAMTATASTATSQIHVPPVAGHVMRLALR